MAIPPEISVVVPVYLSDNTLPKLHARLISTLDQLQVSYEIILIDDDSPSQTWEVITALADSNDYTRGYRLLRNYGQQRALLFGFDKARGRYIVTIDDDLQQSPEDIAALYEEIKRKNLDVVIARFRERKTSLLRRAATKLRHQVSKLTHRSQPGLSHSSFRIIKREVIPNIKANRHPEPIIGYLLMEATSRIGNLDLSHHQRDDGKTSTHTFRSLLRYFIFTAISYSDTALKMAIAIGFLSFIFSSIFSCYLVISWLLGDITVPGYTSTILVIIIFSGLILLTLGMIGLYLNRTLSALSNDHRIIARKSTHDAPPNTRHHNPDM
jgi:polyisoprenyl-phosphate glycosyltransferase